ncbi:MAG TPA: DUF4124 domain-containing protein [Solimonas sp.]|nr:DUF4124 domain-containing protein [Solimonas sp.]
MRMMKWMVVLGLTLATPVFAGQVYKWVDPAGQVHFGDQPQPGWKPFDVRAPSASEQAPAAPAAAEKPAGDVAKLEPNAEQCEKKKKDLESYKAASKVIEHDPLGRKKEYSEEEKQKLVEVTQQQADQLCAN